MRQLGTWSRLVIVTGLCVLGGCNGHSPFGIFVDSTKDCAEMLLQRDIQTVAKTREQRFLGKVPDTTARCLGGKHAESLREGPWLDWPNYWAAGDAMSQAPTHFLAHAKVIGPNAHGVNGALYELELQRIELIKFNLFDNNKTYEAYVTGRDGEAGPVLNTWPEMRLPQSHPDFTSVGGDQTQVCRGELVRFRTPTGTCNDIRNPLMGSTHQLFARNVEFTTTFPDLGLNEMTRNRHGDRLGLLKPDPQVISRKLFTRSGERLIDVGTESIEADPFGQTGFEHDFHRLRPDSGQENFHPVAAQLFDCAFERVQAAGIHRRDAPHPKDHDTWFAARAA